ncbi:MAG TPA: hypothetical protein VLG37_00185 [Candidatus Saccharimonadales bacterium]|nr:hypothetical protein [Candidatus Saccharimonadales bacterium]
MSHIWRTSIKKLKSLSGALAHYFSYGIAAGALLFTLVAPTAAAAAQGASGYTIKTDPNLKYIGKITVPVSTDTSSTSGVGGVGGTDLSGTVDTGSAVDTTVGLINSLTGKPIPCTASKTSVTTTDELTGYAYVWLSTSELWVDWVIGNANVYASPNCAKTVGYEDSATDTSSFCTPFIAYGWSSNAENDASSSGIDTGGNVISQVPYVSHPDGVPCIRASAVVDYQVKGYYYNNVGTRIPIGCKDRSWKVTLKPEVVNLLGTPSINWFDITSNGENDTCAAW